MAEALILPFPRYRNERLVHREASRAAALDADAGELHITELVTIHANSMRRHGIAEDLIERESKCLRSAVRAALWRAVYGTGAKSGQS